MSDSLGDWLWRLPSQRTAANAVLTVVLDAFSRKVVGWAMGEQMTAPLIVSALNMALHTRKPESVIHHSDRGSQ